jgi:methyltransferase (TIGR00027 family)
VSLQPSRTSIWAASARAVGSRFEGPLRNPDWLADKLMGPEERAMIAGHPLATALENDTPENRHNPEVQSAAATLVIRTKFIDERLERMVREGATQVVIMGAGWDTRAYRFAGILRNVRVFEVDQPATQNSKRRRAEEALGPPPANLTYLPIDFRVQTLADVLASAGYDPKQKTLFIWEGVTMYLPAAAVSDTLRWIAQQAPGSMITFDFADEALIDLIARARQGEPPADDRAKLVMDRLRQIAGWGEPWIFGVPTNESARYIQEQGLEHRETLGMASIEAAKRYLGWTEDRPYPAAIRQMYKIAEAVVPA